MGDATAVGYVKLLLQAESLQEKIGLPLRLCWGVLVVTKSLKFSRQLPGLLVKYEA